MALQFPLNPSVGDLYQTGSSAEYRFTDKNYWEVVKSSPLEIISASYSLTALSSSYATTASYAETAPYPSQNFGIWSEQVETFSLGSGTDIIPVSPYTLVGGDITYDSGTGGFTLTANHTYCITGTIALTGANTTNRFCYISLLDSQGTVAGAWIRALTRDNTITGTCSNTYIYTPTVNTTVRLKVTATDGTFLLRSASSLSVIRIA